MSSERMAADRSSDRAGLPAIRVRALWRRVVAHFGVAAAAGAVAALAGVAAASAWLSSAAAWQRPSPVPLLVWLGAFAGLALWLGHLGRRFRAWDRRAAAREIESARELAAGDVEGAVESGLERPGVSSSLVRRHRLWIAERLGGLAVGALGSTRARGARRDAWAAASIALVVTGLAATAWLAWPQRSAAGWAGATHPLRHLSAPPLPPVRVHADGREVPRGRDLPVEIEALGRDSAALVWRSAGQVASLEWLALSAGRARGVVPRVEAPTRFWVSTVDGAVSDTLDVTPVDPLLLLELQVAVRFPPHTRRETEVFAPPFPVITAPQGSRAQVTGKTTLPVVHARLSSAGGATVPLRVTDGRRFGGSFRVRSAAFAWDLVGSSGEPLTNAPDSLRLVAVPDSVPTVRITYPGADTVLGVEMIQPLLIEARDDYGLSRVELISWRESESGESWPPVTERVTHADDGPRAHLSARLDVRGRGFFPGDAVHYYVRAFDNAPNPQVGRSREYTLRLPALDEVRERNVARAWDLVEEAVRLSESARAHERASRALDRATDREPGQAREGRGDASDAGIEFHETEATRRALADAEALREQVQELDSALRELQEAVERAGLNDSSVLERIREVESLFQRIVTPELAAKLEQLREALLDLDSERIREAIRQLAEGSVDFRERIEQSVELLRRAALEHEFAVLETEAQELLEAQEQLDAGVREPGQTPGQDEQTAERLAERVGELAERIERLAGELADAREAEAGAQAEEARSSTAAAASADREVAATVRRRPSRAREAAERARARMRNAASALEMGRQQMQAGWRDAVVAALERARAEALELARRQQASNDRLAESTDGDELRDIRTEEVALRRALDQIEQQLRDASRGSLLVDPSLLGITHRISEELDRLLAEMAVASTGRRVSPGPGMRVAEGLSDLAYRLMQAGEAAGSSESGTGFEEALQRLAQLAEQQGSISDQAGGLMPGAPTPSPFTQLQALARQQRRIAQELGRLDRSMGPRGQVLGRLDAMSKEADEIADRLERGALDQQLVERQERLFRRLLDAGRTLERDEFSKERLAQRPGAIDPVDPGGATAELEVGPEFPHPRSGELQPFPPVVRRLIMDYFDQLNRAGSEDAP